MTSHSNFKFGPHGGFDDLLTVHPTELNIPFDFNEDDLSSSIQLTNITDRVVAYEFLCPWRELLAYHVGTILPHSTSSVTMKLLGNEPPPKKLRCARAQQQQPPRCQAEGCNIDLSGAKHYHRRNKVCEFHFKASIVLAAGMKQRFCLQCSRFHVLGEFDESKRSCRKKIAAHNRTRRKLQNPSSSSNNNSTDEMVATQTTIHLVSPDEYIDVGTILPRSTTSVTVKLGRRNKSRPEDKEWIDIDAYVVKDGVKAEDITSCNLSYLTDEETYGFFRMPVVPAANPYSAVVPEENEKGDDNNLLHQSINDEVLGTTSEGKGSESSVRRQSSNEMSSIILFSDDEIKGATNGLSDSSMIGQGGYETVYKGYLHDIEVAIKMLDPNSQQGVDEFLKEEREDYQ